MGKELGKKINKNFVKKIGRNLNLTKHCKERLKERSDLWVENDLSKTVWNVNYAISHCKFAFSNNDKTISIVLKSGLVFVCTYDDLYKRWNLITLKDHSVNGVSPFTKMKIAQTKSTDRYKWEREMQNEKNKRFKERTRNRIKYKRDNSWKGEEW